LILINVYNDENNTALELLLQSDVLFKSYCIITGDFNLHDPLWGGEDDSTSRASERLIEAMNHFQFNLMNPSGEPTFERGEQTSTIDLTWISAPASVWIRDWRIHHHLDFSSDHLPITFRFEDTDLETPNEADDQKFVFKKDDKKEWVSLLARKLNFADTRRHEICTPERLDHLINTLTKAMTETSTEICLSKKPPPQSHLWFTKEVKTALTNV
jgi:hypothetical protein